MVFVFLSAKTFGFLEMVGVGLKVYFWQLRQIDVFDEGWLFFWYCVV